MKHQGIFFISNTERHIFILESCTQNLNNKSNNKIRQINSKIHKSQTFGESEPKKEISNIIVQRMLSPKNEYSNINKLEI